MFGFIGKLFLKLIGGSRNERIISARMQFVRERINPLEPRMRELSDEQMLQASRELRSRLDSGESRDAVKAEAFALVREASRRGRDHRQFDVQLVAGLILDGGWIAEEATGEGKTIACYPAIYMAYLEGMHSHVVTVNDYLVRRDAEFAAPIFKLLGMTVGYITSDMPSYGPEAKVRRRAYACDVTYGTNSEFGFDYLRDNMKMSTADQVQGPLQFAIIDEVDNILVDEARTPLIISGPAFGQTERYRKADAVAGELINRNRGWDRANRRVDALKREIKALRGEASKASGDTARKIEKQLARATDQLAEAENQLDGETKHFEIEMDRKAVHMTHEGVAAAQEIAGVGSFYVGANMEWPHLMEQALRAHMVYEKDTDYVNQNGEIVIVDEFTGRLMEGRQWSDGLHQAIEAKERVRIKEETQTIATITIQNFFKLYRKLAGMTGTAMTEAGEFLKIYKLDVAAVPTHRPVNRRDHNDRIYADVESKYQAIVEEIRRVSRDLGRPVLVGTTSIEKSEKLSQMLSRSYGIEHEVLNARPENAGREAEIVANAGQQRPLKKDSSQMVGNVTLATNMAGRGTDIKLAQAVVHAACRVPSPEKLTELGAEAEMLFPQGATKCCIHCPQYDAASGCAHCFKPKLDSEFPARGRTACCQDTPCGLHIIGTERHEARRIDNQLRGRSGRQGDPGSSRFFLSLRDDLMAIFAGEWTLKVLGWLGLQGQNAIEDKRVSRGIGRAQRKVEERNFEIRKSLLEYDEVMDYQRRAFYSLRQKVLKGRELEGLVMGMVLQSLEEAVGSYLDGRYRQRCIAEWARQTLQIPIRDDQVQATGIEELPDLEADLRARAREEADHVITITLGEYMGDDVEPGQWDLRGLSSWAMSRFGVNISQNQLRKMTPQEVEAELSKLAGEQIDEMDLTPAAKYLQQGYAEQALAEWVRNKFGIEVAADQLGGEGQDVQAALGRKVRQAYRRREIEYPVDYAIDMTIAQAGTANVYAVGKLTEWANRKFGANLNAEDFSDARPEDVRSRLVGLSERACDDASLRQRVRGVLGDDPGIEQAIQFAREQFDTKLQAEDFDSDVVGRLVEAGRAFLRREMTELERFVLLQIYDGSWKDHLLAMDHLKSAVGLRGFAEQDPRVAFKREGAKLFEQMSAGVREKVTDMIFKVRLTAEAQVSSVYQISNLVHEQLSGYDHFAQEMAQQQAAGQQQKVQTIVRDVPKVGRNDPCPCGSGKKYKKCCGRNT
ncbi:MAG: preprotein translocase subunit SecA [Planctomycetota bacterium]|nr:preprotein translocase subunit SecA [Planctomycetota bacterium]